MHITSIIYSRPILKIKALYMHLQDYLNSIKMSQGAFARKIGITSNYISMIITGRKKPGRTLIKYIDFVTEGVVSEQDWKKK